LAFVIQSEFEQATSETSFERFVRKLAKTGRLLFQCLAESRNVQFKIVNHRTSNSGTARPATRNIREDGAGKFIVIHLWASNGDQHGLVVPFARIRGLPLPPFPPDQQRTIPLLSAPVIRRLHAKSRKIDIVKMVE